MKTLNTMKKSVRSSRYLQHERRKRLTIAWPSPTTSQQSGMTLTGAPKDCFPGLCISALTYTSNISVRIAILLCCHCACIPSSLIPEGRVNIGQMSNKSYQCTTQTGMNGACAMEVPNCDIIQTPRRAKSKSEDDLTQGYTD